MWPRLALVTVLAACGFTHGASGGGGGDAALRDSPGMGLDAMRDAMRPPDAVIDAAPGACPPGYDIQNGTSHYRKVTASTTWTGAESACEMDGVAPSLPAHLIVLDDQNEATWAYGTMNSNQWAGESDRIAEGAFLAVTDQATFYLNPANNKTPDDCAVIVLPAGQGNPADTQIESCSVGHPFLCECDVLAADPTHF